MSAVQKISRKQTISCGTVLYRGLGGNLDLPKQFWDQDKTGCAGFCEWGFMSTTADKAVAVMYSGIKEGKPFPSILEIESGAVDRGADISNFSQYPGEH